MSNSFIHNATKTVGWGVYCACSWTWCIGMFLPIIMLKRYGWTGFLVFAIPNVIGCAAFGYVLRNRQRSESMIAKHRPAMIVFSLVTITFHVFFAGFLTIRLGSGSEWIHLLPGVGLALAVFIAGVAVSAIPLRLWPWIAVIVYGISLAALISIGIDPLKALSWHGTKPMGDALMLAPTIAFGFLLCPYLDLTFHKALQQTPSKHSFGVFGITFAIMLILTAAYNALGDRPIDELFAGNTLAGQLLVAHLIMQIVFTIGVHSRELREQRAVSALLKRNGVLLLPLLGLVPIIAGSLLQWTYLTNEQMYLRWLVFYGLIAPAYIFVFIGPWRAKALTPTNLAQVGVAIVAFMPLYELGFLHHWTVAVVPPVVLLVLAVVVTPGTAMKTPKR